MVCDEAEETKATNIMFSVSIKGVGDPIVEDGEGEGERDTEQACYI